MYAEAYISSGGVKTLCRFNHFRSRQQYLCFCSHSLHSVWEEWNKDGSLSDYRKYIFFKLQEAGRLFIFEGGEVVSHRNLLVYQNEIPVSPDILNSASVICSVLFYKYSIPPGLSCAGFASLSFLFIRGITYGPEKKSNYWNWGMPFGQPDISAPWQKKKRKGYISGACSDSSTFRFRTIPAIGSVNLA